MRVTRVRDLDRGAEHRDCSVILSTLAFLSRSMTLAASRPHLILRSMSRRLPRKSGFQFALSCRSMAEVRVTRDGSELARPKGGMRESPQASGAARVFANQNAKQSTKNKKENNQCLEASIIHLLRRVNRR